MDTVFIKWTIFENERHQVIITGVVSDTQNKQRAERILFYNIFLMIAYAIKYNGRIKTPEHCPNMHNITAYFELSFNSKSDVIKFIEAVKKGS